MFRQGLGNEIFCSFADEMYISMSNESCLPDCLNELLYPESKNPAQSTQLSKNDIIHEAMAEVFAKYPNSAFKWNWRKWRYECTIDGRKVYATLYEYRKSRRIRFYTPGVL